MGGRAWYYFFLLLSMVANTYCDYDVGETSSSGLLRSEDLPPPEFDEDELAAYAEDLAAIAGLEDISEEDLFGWSDFEDVDHATAPVASFSVQGHPQVENDDDMCIN